MGRWITCGDEAVWKYRFGAQPSEMYRVSEQLGIGEHHFVQFGPPFEGPAWRSVDLHAAECEGDVLILFQSHAPQLDASIPLLASEPYFQQMVAALRDFLRSHPDQERFEFFGEF